MNQDPIPVILSCDDKFVRHAACTIASIVKNSDRRYQFYLLDCGISEHNKQKLAAWDLGGNTLTVMPMEKVEAFEQVPLKPWFSPAIFYRLLIPELFPELTKAIYLDSDMVVVGDLGDLWDIDLGDKLMGVVYEEGVFFPQAFFSKRKHALNLPNNQRYFNSGMLYMNCMRLRANGFVDRCCQLINHRGKRLLYPDQDILNCVLNNDQIYELFPVYNWFAHIPVPDSYQGTLCILHFAGFKPWYTYQWVLKLYPLYVFRQGLIYYHYTAFSPFKDEIHADLDAIKTVRFLWKSCFAPVERFVKNYLKRMHLLK